MAVSTLVSTAAATFGRNVFSPSEAKIVSSSPRLGLRGTMPSRTAASLRMRFDTNDREPSGRPCCWASAFSYGEALSMPRVRGFLRRSRRTASTSRLTALARASWTRSPSCVSIPATACRVSHPSAGRRSASMRSAASAVCTEPPAPLALTRVTRRAAPGAVISSTSVCVTLPFGAIVAPNPGVGAKTGCSPASVPPALVSRATPMPLGKTTSVSGSVPALVAVRRTLTRSPEAATGASSVTLRSLGPAPMRYIGRSVCPPPPSMLPMM